MSQEKSGSRARYKPSPSKLALYSSILVIFFIVFSALILSGYQTIVRGGIVGSDFGFHYSIAREYAAGENGLFSETAFNVNGGPYPPLFHLFFALAEILGISKHLAFTIQVLAFPAIMAVFAFVVYRMLGLKTAAMTSAILFSSVALFDRAQVIPQTVDMILFPLGIYFFFKGRKWPFVLCMAIPIYAHGMWALLLWGAPILYTVIMYFRADDKKSKELSMQQVHMNLWALVVVLPMIILTAIYFPGYMSIHGDSPQSAQESHAQDIFYLMDYLGLAIVAAIAVAAVWAGADLARSGRWRYKLTKMETMCLYWTIVLLPVFLFVRDRFCSFAAPPLALLGAAFIVRKTMKNDKLFVVILIIITVLAFAYQAVLLGAFVTTDQSIFLSRILKAYGVLPM